MLSGTYGGQLLKKDKRLFFAVALFFILSIAANFILRLETTPFLVWDMYSHPFPRQSVYTINEIRYDGRLLNIREATWEEHSGKCFLFTTPLSYAISPYNRTNAGKDPFAEYMKDHWGAKASGIRQPVCPRYIIPRIGSGPFRTGIGDTCHSKPACRSLLYR